MPSGLVIISKQYWEIFFHCLASRTSPSLALTHELLSKHLTSVADEFTRILGLFGQSVGTSVKDWVSSVIDPKTSAELTSWERGVWIWWNGMLEWNGGRVRP